MGAAPGVGKTFAMLNEGWRRRERGIDVVVALVETHGRANTAEQVRDLEVIPRRSIVYRDQTFEEMDVEAVLARRPDLALVDELAHTNVPGSRNAKRWQDVEELLAAGINVITTVNVQHLESLNDVVEHITGITQRETVPDVFVRNADQIELVDMTPQALRRRMAHGNVYDAEKVDAALANYFREGNLAALRELALLWVADRVDEGLEDYRERHRITETWETRERVLVAVTGAPGGDRLIRRGARLAAKSRAELIGLHVRSTDGLSGERGELERDRRLLEELGGRFAEVVGNDVAEALTDFAVAENVTQIVMGASRRSRWTELIRGSVINRVIAGAQSVDVHVLSFEPDDAAANEGNVDVVRSSVSRRAPRRRAQAWAAALLGVPLLALALAPLDEQIGASGALMILILGPVCIALLGGLYPALASSLIAFLMADWFYIPPANSLRIQRPGDAVALVVFATVAALVSGLVDQLSRRTAQLARGRSESVALARLAQGTLLLDDGAEARLVAELRSALQLDAVAVLSRVPGGWTVEAASGAPVPVTPLDATYAADLSDDTALVVSGGVFRADQQLLLSAFVAHLRLARETLRLRADAETLDRLSEATILHEAVVEALGHDVAVPIAGLRESVATLRGPADDSTRQESVALAVQRDTDRIEAVLAKLLELHRLQIRARQPRIQPVDIAALLHDTLESLRPNLPARVKLMAGPDLPPAAADPVLLARLLTNVISNALTWSPEDTPVRIEAAKVVDHLDIRVVDRGPGISRLRQSVLLDFSPTATADQGTDAVTTASGMGLPLARSFADAMGAEILLSDTPGGGATVTVRVPLAALHHGASSTGAQQPTPVSPADVGSG